MCDMHLFINLNYPLREIDGHSVIIIDRDTDIGDIPPSLFIYDSFLQPDNTNLRFRLHKEGPLMIPALICTEELPLDEDGVYIITDWKHIAPEPFGPWLRTLVEKYQTRTNVYYKWLVSSDYKQNKSPQPDKPNYAEQVVLPIFGQLAKLLPVGLKPTVPQENQCVLNWGLYKIKINNTLIGGIAPTFDQRTTIYFVIANRNDGIRTQQSVESVEQLARLVMELYEIRKGENDVTKKEK